MSPQEAREASRALRGSPLRVEVRALDGDRPESSPEKAELPYTVAETNYSLFRVQPIAGNRYGSFLVVPRETLSRAYDRYINAAGDFDPKSSHQLTLTVDRYGTPLKTLAVSYPRREVPEDGLEVQGEIAYGLTEQWVEHLDIFENPDHRARKLALPIESRSYEFKGPDRNDANLVTIAEVRADIDATANIVPHETPSETLASGEKRLLSRQQTFYYDVAELELDPMGGRPALFEVAGRAIVYQTRAAVVSEDHMPTLYHDDIKAELLSGSETTTIEQLWQKPKVGYELDDGLYWVTSGRVLPDPTRFFLIQKGIDPMYRSAAESSPFLALYTPQYDANNLLLVSTQDPLGNMASVEEFDWVHLAPVKLKDPNGNFSEVRFNTLGLVTDVAVHGLTAGGEFEGDHIDDPVEPATIHYDYDMHAWEVDGSPLRIDVATKVQHEVETFIDAVEDLPDPSQYGAQNGVLRSVAYLDGGGGVVLQKIQAEAGIAYFRNPDGSLATQGTGEDLELSTQWVESDRWIANGRTILDNKGNPVRQYEPYAVEGDQFDPEDLLATTGVTVELNYDALSRNIRTDLPNKTHTKVEFTPWMVASFDPNDTVTDSAWWFERETLPLSDPEGDARNKAEAHDDTPSIVHIDTQGREFLSIADDGAAGIQSRSIFDFEGNLIEAGTIASALPLPTDLGKIAARATYVMGGVAIHTTSVDAGPRWLLPNIVGNPVRSWDMRDRDEVAGMDLLRKHTTTYDLLHRPKDQFITVDGSDDLIGRTYYGEELVDSDPVATNHRGRVYQVYDGAGTAKVIAYDFKGNALQSERLLTKVDVQSLQAGDRLQAKWTTFIGSNAALALDERERPAPDGLGGMAELIEAEPDDVFETDPALIAQTKAVYDGLDCVLSCVAADGSRTHYSYNRAGLLDKVELTHAREATATKVPVVANIDYDEKGRRAKIVYGDGVASSTRRGTTTRYRYDRETFRLTEMVSYKNSVAIDDQSFAELAPNDPFPQPQGLLQRLQYTYDPVGNITRLKDQAQPTVFSNNTAVHPVNDYTYDAVYRLVLADGREHAAMCGNAASAKLPDDFSVPLLSDGSALRRYQQVYTYDELGNIERMQHKLGANWSQDCWTRHYEYSSDGCRLERTWGGNDTRPTLPNYVHNNNGQMTSMPGQFTIELDDFDQMAYSNEGDTHVWYQYDGSGQRVRKIFRNGGNDLEPGECASKDRVYFGGYGVFHCFINGQVDRKTETLHVSDDMGRICLVDAQKVVVNGVDSGDPATLKWKFQLGNHLGSASMEVTEGADVISYEEYHPYGTTSFLAGASETDVAARRYRYTGKERDEETGLSYHGARYYAPWLGRWTAVDPIGLGDGPNRFAYVRGNPIAMSDPSGTNGFPSLWALQEAFGSFFEFSIGGSANPRRDNKPQMPKGGIGGAAYGVLNEVTLRQGDFQEDHPTELSKAGSEFGASQVPVVNPALELATGETTTKKSANRVVSGASLVLDVIGVGMELRQIRQLRRATHASDAANRVDRPGYDRTSQRARVPPSEKTPIGTKDLQEKLDELKDMGINVEIGTAEAKAKLKANNADGLYSANPVDGQPGTVYLKNNPTEPEVFEEVIHAKQDFRRGFKNLMSDRFLPYDYAASSIG